MMEEISSMKEEIDKEIEKWLPRKANEKTIINLTNGVTYSFPLIEYEEGFSKPLYELLDRGGKRWRPVLLALVAEAFGVKKEIYKTLFPVIEVIHNSSLISDDIEDGSEMRRGKPAIHKIFGTDIALNASELAYFAPVQACIIKNRKIGKRMKFKLLEIYLEEMTKLSLGQATDIVWHNGIGRANEITEKEYFQMCAWKTGTLARMAAKMGAALGNASEEAIQAIGEYAEKIGIAFQIQDDILELTGEEFTQKKGGIGKDITEGKRSLMVIHTLQVASQEDKKRLLEILSMHTTDQNLINEAISLMKKYNSIEYAKDVARKLVEEGWAKASPYIPEGNTKEKLKELSNFLIERKI
ncbi:MAG: polyprenyl synthetase family protein [Candidatus Micrarchaeia archaeon]